MANVQLIDAELPVVLVHAFDLAHPHLNWHTGEHPPVDIPDDLLARWTACHLAWQRLQAELRQVQRREEPRPDYRRARGVIPYDATAEKPEVLIRRQRDDW